MRRRNNRALALIAVLWVAVVLTVIAASVARNCRLDSRLYTTTEGQLRCRWACRAGLERAVAVLNEDTRASDSLGDLWSENEADFNDVSLQGCRFTVRVEDEAGKLNVNTASKEQLLGLEGMTEEVAEAIIDWRDKDDNPGASGAEQAYYQNLPYGYVIGNRPFRTIRELLAVKGVTEELLYGEDTNLNGKLDYNENDGDASSPHDDQDGELDRGWIAYLTCYSYDREVDSEGQDRVNINKASQAELQRSLDLPKPYAKWIVENRKNGYKSIADLLTDNSGKAPPRDMKRNSDRAVPLDVATFKRIADKITVNDKKKIPGRVNVNTASKEVLAALLGGDESAEQTAQSIISYRQTLLDGMSSVGELLDAGSISVATFKKIVPYLTTRSDVFTVRCFAESGQERGPRIKLESEAVVDRSSRPCKVLYWYVGGPAYVPVRAVAEGG